MRKLLKRFAAAASAVVIGGVSCVTTWFSVPASAAAGIGWLEFQSLLQGIGIGGNNSDFADSVQDWIDGIGGVEMPREDYDGEWMTNYEYYNRVGWDEIIDWFDGLFSGDNDYTDVADVGTDVSGGSKFSCADWSTSSDNFAMFRDSFSYSFTDGASFLFSFFPDSVIDGHYPIISMVRMFGNDSLCLLRYGSSGYYIAKWSSSVLDPNNSNGLIYSSDRRSCLFPRNNYGYDNGQFPYTFPSGGSITSSDFSDFINFLGLHPIDIDATDLIDKINDHYDEIDWKPGATGTDGFIGPVYTYPAAQELYKSTGTAAGIRLDVQTQDGVPDVQAALDGAGVETVDDLVAGVAAGTVPMSQVFADAKVTPYVVADTTSGIVVTDLGVSATAAGVKSVGLTQDLAVPKDLTSAATYSIKGKTWDPEMSKYKLPLFQYFPFCLPWDIYQVLAAFSADPVAPVFDVPVGKILSGVHSADVSKAASVSAKINFGDDNWSKVFEIIRILECAGIIVGLCLVAVYLIHGGR